MARLRWKMLTPSATDTSLNTFTLGLEMDITISATAEYGTIENVYLFLDGQLLNLPVAFPPEDRFLASTAGTESMDSDGRPIDREHFELSVQAIDDSGRVSEITELSKATIVVGSDSIGETPIVE